MASTIKMYKFNPIKNRTMSVNDAAITSKSKLSRTRLDTTLDNCLDIENNSARCSVHRWLDIESESHT